MSYAEIYLSTPTHLTPGARRRLTEYKLQQQHRYEQLWSPEEMRALKQRAQKSS